MGEWKKTQCQFCAVSCGIELEVENGEIVSVRPDKDNPRTKGYCCRKGRTSKFYQEHTDRLDYPLKKVGDGFERISWEQAISEISERVTASVKIHGGKTVALVGGGSAATQGEGMFAKALINSLGSPYWYNPVGIEFMGNWWSHGKFFGDQLNFTEPDDENCEALLFWGSNSYVAHNYTNARWVIRDVSQDPDKLLITIDPRLSETARMSDIHIHPRLGTDALLLRGIIALIIDKGWQHTDYIEKYTTGYSQILPWFEGFDYRRAFEVCQVPLGQMEEFARILTTKRWGVHQDLGIFFGRNNTITSYLVLLLQAICGVALQKGGAILLPNVLAKGQTVDENDPKTVRTVETNRFPVLGFYPEAVLTNEILSRDPQHIRSVFVTLSNPMRSYPDTNMMEKALKSLELLVVVDVTMTETAMLADYVLPVKSGYEAYDFNTFNLVYPEICFGVKQPVLPSKGERKEGAKIWIELLMATGGMKKPPERLYRAAQKAVETGDRMTFFFKAAAYMAATGMSMDVFPAMLGEVLGSAMGSPTLALAWAGMLISPLAGTGQLEKYGIKPLGFHPVLEKLPKLKDIFVMDAAFQRVYEHPEGALLGYVDIDAMMKNYIKHKDKKIHLWCVEIDKAIGDITPQREAEALTLSAEYPMLLSSGRHADAGVNSMIRNPATYAHRKPYAVSMNPKDAMAAGLTDGDNVRIVTKAGEVEAPLEVSIQMAEGYIMIPHYFGMSFGGKAVGQAANLLTSREDNDPITGNPYLRYIPCRVEKIKEGA